MIYYKKLIFFYYIDSMNEVSKITQIEFGRKCLELPTPIPRKLKYKCIYNLTKKKILL